MVLFNCIVSTGAAADFQQATTIATAMVKRFGMSEKVTLST